VADDTKAQDVLVLHVAPLVSWCSYMVFSTVVSKPQLLAVMARTEQAAEAEWDRSTQNSPGSSPWEVQDFGDVVRSSSRRLAAARSLAWGGAACSAVACTSSPLRHHPTAEAMPCRLPPALPRARWRAQPQVVHVMTPEQRELYDLESFYAAAEEVDLPFLEQQGGGSTWSTSI
jgi:ribosomal silencing factor RsfS